MTLAAERLRHLLAYDPLTGQFSWKVCRGNQTAPAGAVAGSTGKNGYRSTKIDGVLYRNCRLAWLYMTGSWPISEVDHVDRDKSNDRWCNLRLATRQENCRNRTKIRTKHQLPKGVHNNWKRFAARIWDNGKLKHLGTFDTPEQAAAVYQSAAKELHGDFCAVERTK